MHVLIFQTGEPVHTDGSGVRPMRAMNLANKLIAHGHTVDLITSDFYHQKRQHRFAENKKINFKAGLTIHFISSPGYQKSVSFNRIWDHVVLAINLRSYLRNIRQVPDVVFVGYPPIESAFILSKWCVRNSVPYFIDIKDQWPTIFSQSIPRIFAPFMSTLLKPLVKMARYSMRNAHVMCTHSNGFMDWLHRFSGRAVSDRDIIVPLSSPLIGYDQQGLAEARRWWANHGVEQNSKLRIVFVGSFSQAFDFEPVLDAAAVTQMRGMHCEFVLCGDGEQKQTLKSKSQGLHNFAVIDWIDTPKIITLSEMADLVIAPYKNSSDFKLSIPNKIIDALQLGLPILSPLQGELENLLIKNKCGFSYDNSAGLVDILKILLESPSKLEDTSRNACATYESSYNFDKVYNDLVSSMERIIEHE